MADDSGFDKGLCITAAEIWASYLFTCPDYSPTHPTQLGTYHRLTPKHPPTLKPVEDDKRVVLEAAEFGKFVDTLAELIHMRSKYPERSKEDSDVNFINIECQQTEVHGDDVTVRIPPEIEQTLKLNDLFDRVVVKDERRPYSGVHRNPPFEAMTVYRHGIILTRTYIGLDYTPGIFYDYASHPRFYLPNIDPKHADFDPQLLAEYKDDVAAVEASPWVKVRIPVESPMPGKLMTTGELWNHPQVPGELHRVTGDDGLEYWESKPLKLFTSREHEWDRRMTFSRDYAQMISSGTTGLVQPTSVFAEGRTINVSGWAPLSSSWDRRTNRDGYRSDLESMQLFPSDAEGHITGESIPMQGIHEWAMANTPGFRLKSREPYNKDITTDTQPRRTVFNLKKWEAKQYLFNDDVSREDLPRLLGLDQMDIRPYGNEYYLEPRTEDPEERKRLLDYVGKAMRLAGCGSCSQYIFRPTQLQLRDPQGLLKEIIHQMPMKAFDLEEWAEGEQLHHTRKALPFMTMLSEVHVRARGGDWVLEPRSRDPQQRDFVARSIADIMQTNGAEVERREGQLVTVRQPEGALRDLLLREYAHPTKKEDAYQDVLVGRVL